MSFKCDKCGRFAKGCPIRIVTQYRLKTYPARTWEVGKDEFKTTKKDPGGTGREIMHEEDICKACDEKRKLFS